MATTVPSARAIAEALSQPVRLKTWSLIVTLFGDAIMPHGGRIYASDLNSVMEETGITAGAVRTALSRLAGDGIIVREREGRSSIYRLAEEREREFSEAAMRIYAFRQEPSETTEFVLVCGGGQSAEPPAPKAIRLSREWWLIDRERLSGEIPEPFAVFEGTFSRLPQWLVDRVALPELSMAMQHLNDVFSRVLSALEEGGDVTPVQSLALRCLLIHAWRRIALRLRVLPDEFKPDNWPEDESRALVAQLYGRLSVGAEQWLGETLNLPRTRSA